MALLTEYDGQYLGMKQENDANESDKKKGA
jgi:hypothetical protein